MKARNYTALCTLKLLLVIPAMALGQEMEAGNELSVLDEQHLGDFKWMNAREEYRLSEGRLSVRAEKGYKLNDSNWICQLQKI